MEDINNIIEIKRGLHRICHDSLMEIIAESKYCEVFYQKIFQVYGLTYDTATIRQKRCFVAAIAKFFIIDRIPKEYVIKIGGRYDYSTPYKVVRNGRTYIFLHPIDTIIQECLEIWNTSSSLEDFKHKYFEKYNIEVKDFTEEISINRNDELSDFAKAVEQVFFSNDEEK